MNVRYVLLPLAVAIALAGCEEVGAEYQQLGEDCEGTYDCAPPLVCAHDETCQRGGEYPGTGDLDDECESTADCRIEFVCAADAFCAFPGDGVLGSNCQGTEDCRIPFLCTGEGLCANEGDSGTGGNGDACTETTDCEFGLFCGSDEICHRLGGSGDACEGHDQCRATYYCGTDGTCVARGGTGTECTEAAECYLGLTCFGAVCEPIPLYDGLTCQDPASDPGPFRIHFEVPRGQVAGTIEFYRLPFPNDIRVKDGRVDLSGHPDPGTLVPGEIVTKYIAAIEDEMDGFGLNTTSYFRFSAPVDFGSLAISGDDPNIRFVNIDPDSPGYGHRHSGIAFSASTGRTKYICNNWLAIHPMQGYPLRHGTTYAVILLDSIYSADASEQVARDDDFDALLGATAPADADMQAAWLKYAPLRDFLADTTLPPESQIAAADVAVAAVLTTTDPDRSLPAFRHVIRTDPTISATTVADVTLCDAQAVSPCDDGLTGAEHQRGCMGEDPDIFEIHGRYTTPVFQTGQAPYDTDGGLIEFTVDGTPIPQGEQDVCFGLSVPKNAVMPVGGWPVVIYLHGTGGSFRSHIGNGVAVNLADIDLGGGVTTQMAVIGIDQVVHGDRREGSATHPNELFFNLLNPHAAKYNPMQGAADIFQLVRVVESFVEQVNGVGEVRLDPTRIYFFGHSQGVISGPLAIPFEPAIRGVVYSGGGALLIESLLNKTNPVDVTGAVQFILADGDLGYTHPVLNLIQLYFESVDAINYMALHFLNPVAGASPRHTLISYGVGDTYSPNATGRALIRSAAAHLVTPVLDPISYVGETDPPVIGNRWGGNLTEGAVQLDTDTTYDGHFVMFQNPDGATIYTTFLGTMDTDPGGVPTIPAW